MPPALLAAARRIAASPSLQAKPRAAIPMTARIVHPLLDALPCVRSSVTLYIAGLGALEAAAAQGDREALKE
jgi:hypothetical protein